MTTNKAVPDYRTPKKPCIHCGKTLHRFHGTFARCEGGETQYEALPSMEEGTAEAWLAYDMVANDLARRGLKGEIGDPLPNLISSACNKLILDDPEAFAERVRMSAYALAMFRV